MSLRVVSSNRVELLQARLATHLAQPPADPFERETVIVPGMAMARWLNIRLAESLGIAANIQYPLPAAWIWEQAWRLLPDVPEQDPLSRERAAWRLYQCLPPLLSQAAFEPLRHYLADDRDGVRLWQLAVRIADVFDRYQFYRPEWIRRWSRGENVAPAAGQEAGVDAWQPPLWRELIEDLAGNHRVRLIERLLTALDGDPGQVLPSRVSAFALSTLPPLFIDVLKAVARHREVTLFQHSPTEHYWADLRSKKQRARMRISNPGQVDYHDTGNDLLASWGRQGQAFQDLLLDGDVVEESEEHYRGYASDTLLHHVQQSIFALDETRWHMPGDDSLAVSVCHSPLRECQVLHDRILHEMQADPSLRPEDILVMVPEISRYAPYIEAVFRRDEHGSRPFIPWNLSDTTLADEHPLIQVFFQLLDLPGSRFGRSQIMSLLEVPQIAARFALTQKDCDRLQERLRSSQVLWGLDGEHKREFDLPAIEQNTWRHGMDRLLAGYALGDRSLEVVGEAEAEDWSALAPVPVTEAGLADAFGQLMLLLDRLRYWRRQLNTERTAEQWQHCINRLLADFFAVEGEDEDRLQQIREVMETLCQQAAGQTISPALLRLWLEQSLGSSREYGHYFSGGVTFCGMRPMRSLPFRFIAVLGMNDDAFPRRENPVEFDAMARQWRAGDPRKGDEDRYLLLETLLCARDRLHFSYTGRSLRDNEPRQPSVLLRELLDFIDANYLVENDPGTMPSQRLTTVHSMQPFSARNYAPADEDAGSRRAHDRFWCSLAQYLQQPGSPLHDWPGDAMPLPGDVGETVTMAALGQFLRHPVRHFFHQRLGIRLDDDEDYEDEELFDLTGLSGWQVRDRLLGDFLQGRDTSLAELQAEGRLPHGAMAAAAYEAARRDVAPLLERVVDLRGRAYEAQPIELTLADDTRLQGRVRRWLPGVGLVHLTPSRRTRGKHLIDFWLDHLALCAAGVPAEDQHSRLHSHEGTRTLPVLERQDACEQMLGYVALYHRGLQRPLPVGPEASYQLARKRAAGKEPGRDVGNAWHGNSFGGLPGDSEDPYIALILDSGVESPLNLDEFDEIAQQLYARLLQEVGDP